MSPNVHICIYLYVYSLCNVSRTVIVVRYPIQEEVFECYSLLFVVSWLLKERSMCHCVVTCCDS